MQERLHLALSKSDAREVCAVKCMLVLMTQSSIICGNELLKRITLRINLLCISATHVFTDRDMHQSAAQPALGRQAFDRGECCKQKTPCVLGEQAWYHFVAARCIDFVHRPTSDA